MKVKKKTKRVAVSILIISTLVFYCGLNFNAQKFQLAKLIAPSASGNVKQTLINLNTTKGFSNPIVHLIYKYHFKRKYNNRFIQNESESVSSNMVLNNISNIYKEYWKIKLLKKNKIELADSLLQRKLHSYFKRNNLTQLPFEEYSNDELLRIIESQSAKAEFFYLNEIYGISIWDKESVKNYKIELPRDTIQVNVTIIENYLLKDWQNYATVGDSENGGWVNPNKANIYCNKGEYNFTSEKFLISFLKHEGLHFVDVKRYKNLSATDLEYRSKLVEILSLNDYLYERLEEFILFSNSTNRDYSHPYANYILIKKLSKLLFNSEYQSDMNKWKQLSVKDINRAATTLFNDSENTLQKDKDVAKII